MPATDNIGYTGKSQLMDNYGWVQNTSNLSTIRDTVDLIPSEGVDHNSLMRSIYTFQIVGNHRAKRILSKFQKKLKL